MFTLGVGQKRTLGGELILLVDVQIIVLHKSVFAKIAHIDVNFGLILSHIIFHFFHEEIVALCKTRVVFSDLQLILLEFSLHVENKVLEGLLVVKDQLVNHRLMNLDGRKFVLCAFDDDSGKLGEML